ncbi:MAG: hypothetical protein C0469_00275 [Cyanobacteria bacterium DS2.3.42]|nr:hypothetical protein [Cyanobacteria bacterium DS2.3.42]
MKINFELNSSSVVGWFKKYWWALAVPSVFAGVMYFAWTPNPTQGLSDPAEVERQLNGDFTPHSQVRSSLHQPPAAKQEFAEVEVTGTLADGRVHAVVKVPKSNGGGLITDQSDLVKTETWMQSILGGMSAVLMMLGPFIFMGLILWYFNRRGQGVATGLMGAPAPAGTPSASPYAVPSAKNKIPGVPAGMDTSFMTIVFPEDNTVRLNDLILEKGLKKTVSKIANDLGEKKRLFDEARAKLVAEQEAKAKKAGWLDSRSEVKVTVDITDIKVARPKARRFKSKSSSAYLYVGPPGVGKTLMATAIAGSAGVPMISIAGSLENTFLGGGSSRVDVVMFVAQLLGPCIIFIDEAENTTGQRQKGGERFGASADGTTAKWLAAMDGVQQKIGKNSEFMGPGDWIHFALATNYADMIDEAIKRSGRAKIINCPLPTVPLLQRMLKLFVGKKGIPLGPDLDPDFQAAATMLTGKSGADIEAIANSFAEHAEDTEALLKKRMKRQGSSDEDVELALEEMTFGQKDFLFGVIDHLMGAKIEDNVADFERDVNTTVHELFHALAGAVAGHLGLNDDRMRLLCVSRRQKSLGVCYWSSARGERSNYSKRDILGFSILGYAGGASQTLINFPKYSFGPELDFYTDTGAGSDLSVAANLIKDSVALNHGSTKVGPIVKGQNGRTYSSEMGADMVNEIDHEIRARQRLGYAIAHWICSALISHPIIWEMVEEVLISEDNLMVEGRFYDYFDRLLSDPHVRRQIEEALPSFIRQESDKAFNSPVTYTWVPVLPSQEQREFVIGQMNRLEPKYYEMHKQFAIQALEDEAPLSVEPAAAGATPQVEAKA